MGIKNAWQENEDGSYIQVIKDGVGLNASFSGEEIKYIKCFIAMLRFDKSKFVHGEEIQGKIDFVKGYVLKHGGVLVKAKNGDKEMIEALYSIMTK